ncbi:M1 family metallopeptidase [Anthocerotibacter panamensis]|uniref:M1 family metallopeptidase n=1 Tax=Anthocerotibacter panamensis TaxID=2857077 RepID=UPI001C404275|nr:M1 family metallopeptidase [Anthocerotibacter panamensis]
MLNYRLFCMVLLTCLGLGTVRPAGAEAAFSFDTTPGQLPKIAQPRHYAITLTPDLKSLTTQGSETIDIDVQKASKTLVLNALELTVRRAELVAEQGQTATIQTHADQQTVTLTFPKVVTPGVHRLVLSFAGKIGPQPQGLYYDRYLTAKGEKMLLATQMEPTDARRMFPSWDEPVYRATYQLTVVVPQNWLATSNMPMLQEKPAGKGLKSVTFARTPKMSSYLMVLVAGELEALEDEVDGVKVRVITTQGKKEQGRYALQATKQLLSYYNDYFGVKYPLPKLDQIAVPGGFSGAMENWGGIVYNEAILLYDPNRSSQQTREDIYSVIAHEMAHQWFGDLVTMAWWDNLWLNEGFASWMGTKATDHFNPSWQAWLRASADKDTAMALDARRTTHAIQQPVKNESEANDAFDSITYLKGQSFLRMLEAYLGEDGFRDGIRRYMSQHQYSNTTTADLWAALEQSTAKPVSILAAGWTEQPGFPLVRVASSCTGGRRTLTLEQDRFTINDLAPQPLQWRIPVAFNAVGSSTPAAYALLEGKRTTALAGDCQGTLKVNTGNTGYYRVQYQADLALALGKAAGELPAADRVNLLSDTWALVEAGRASAEDYLALMPQVQQNTDLITWQQVLDTLMTMDSLERNQPGQRGFRASGRALLQPLLARLGWEAKPSEPPTMSVLRAKVLTTLGTFGDSGVIAEARKRFQAFRTDPKTLAADLRVPVFYIVGRYSDQKTYDQLRALGRKARTSEDQQQFYNALRAALDPNLARHTLDLALTDELPPTRAVWLVRGVATQGEHPEMAWDFARKNYKALLGKLTYFGRNGYFPSLTSEFNDTSRADELEAFARSKLPAEVQAEIAKGAERIRFQANLKARELPAIDRWVKRQGG